MSNQAFAYGEAETWVRPAGLNSQSVGFAETYSLDRTPVTVEDGSASFYQDRLTIESPWVDEELTTIFEAFGPFDAFIRWTNDDGRLRSVSVTSAILVSAGKSPGEGGIERFAFTFQANSLL